MHKVDLTSIGLSSGSTCLAFLTGSNMLMVLSMVGVFTTIVYNCIRIVKDLKK